MVNNLKELHKITSPRAGLLTEHHRDKKWKDILLSIFNGEDFNWEEIVKRDYLNKDLILKSVENIIKKINSTNMEFDRYSLMHTDFNQRNLFVDQHSDNIAGIIDWEEAMFGDPIYDFARVRMYIWHFNMNEDVIFKYYKLMNYSPDERGREDLYWLSKIIQYLAWYSEEFNDFNIGRIELHQEFLRRDIW